MLALAREEEDLSPAFSPPMSRRTAIRAVLFDSWLSGVSDCRFPRCSVLRYLAFATLRSSQQSVALLSSAEGFTQSSYGVHSATNAETREKGLSVMGRAPTNNACSDGI